MAKSKRKQHRKRDAPTNVDKTYIDNFKFKDGKTVKIYVDGSYDAKRGVYGYGYVVLEPNGTVGIYNKAGNNPEVAEHHNVAGEMLAAMSAVLYAEKHGFECLELYYDYTGIELWATGKWGAKKYYTGLYQDFMREHMKNIHVEFHKVAAHTNVSYNELADKLAKEAIKNFKD